MLLINIERAKGSVKGKRQFETHPILFHLDYIKSTTPDTLMLTFANGRLLIFFAGEMPFYNFGIFAS